MMFIVGFGLGVITTVWGLRRYGRYLLRKQAEKEAQAKINDILPKVYLNNLTKMAQAEAKQNPHGN